MKKVDVKAIAEMLINPTSPEINDLVRILKDEYDIKPASTNEIKLHIRKIWGEVLNGVATKRNFLFN